ncbi:MAG: glutathione S-transferase N-terminal domain-containing protein [Gammaproteobacteria bacterium]|nr:glutathione S-transferase N-terminal domain-containing protein [Gammaproteobacteria bacterium]
MIDLYYFPSPNGLKIAIMLEECGLPYEVVPVDIGSGEQFRPEYLALNPNNKIPTIVDRETGTSVFESGAILIYLAEKSNQFLPKSADKRIAALSWLFWQVGGLGPMAGQAHHFRAFATEEVPYGIERYTNEVNRLYGVMERRLNDVSYLAGDYSIADIACWPWIASHERQGQDLDDFRNVKRWFETVRDRPAVIRGFALGHEQMVDRESYEFLYGQTAARVKELEAEQQKKDSTQ